MITHRGIWAIAHMLSRKHSIEQIRHLLQTFINSWRVLPKTFVNSVSNKHHSRTHTRHRVQQTHSALPLTKARIGLERQRQTRAVWAKRTEYSIEQIRQSLQRLKIAKIVRMRNLRNFRTIDSVFFFDTRLRYKLSIIDTRLSQTHRVGHSSHSRSRARVPRNHPPNQEDPSSVHDIWVTIHMSSQQLATPKCFHCVTKVGYS